MGMGGGTGKRYNLGKILLNETKDFALGAAYEQVCTTIGFYGRKVVNKLEDNMAYKSAMSSLGFAAGAVIDGVLINQMIEGNATAKYILAGKAITVANSFAYKQLKELKKNLQR
jgi:uncharacterized protein YdaL